MPKLLIMAGAIAAMAAVGVLIGSLPIALIARSLQRRRGWSERGALRAANAVWIAGTSLLLAGGAVLLAALSEPGSGIGIYFAFMPAWFAISWCPLLASAAVFRRLGSRHSDAPQRG